MTIRRYVAAFLGQAVIVEAGDPLASQHRGTRDAAVVRTGGHERLHGARQEQVRGLLRDAGLPQVRGVTHLRQRRPGRDDGHRTTALDRMIGIAGRPDGDGGGGVRGRLGRLVAGRQRCRGRGDTTRRQPTWWRAHARGQTQQAPHAQHGAAAGEHAIRGPPASAASGSHGPSTSSCTSLNERGCGSGIGCTTSQWRICCYSLQTVCPAHPARPGLTPVEHPHRCRSVVKGGQAGPAALPAARSGLVFVLNWLLCLRLGSLFFVESMAFGYRIPAKVGRHAFTTNSLGQHTPGRYSTATPFCVRKYQIVRPVRPLSPLIKSQRSSETALPFELNRTR